MRTYAPVWHVGRIKRGWFGNAYFVAGEACMVLEVSRSIIWESEQTFRVV